MTLEVDKERCSGCGQCVPVCPVQAISIREHTASIDRAICTECLLCMNECPENAISQTAKKDIEHGEREYQPAIPLEHPSPPARRPVANYPQEKWPATRESFFLSRLKRVVDEFFSFDSRLAQRGRGGGGRRRRQRGTRKGRRF